MDVDFYRLDRPIQDRFSDATRAIGVPVPILRQPAVDRAPIQWGLFAAVVAGALVAGVLFGFGNIRSPLAIVPVSHAVGYGALVAVSAFCLLRALAARNARDRLPYEPGLYLFPAGVFDARVEPIRAFRHPEIRELSVVDARRVRVRVENGEFVFDVHDSSAAEEARTLFDKSKEQWDTAKRTENRRELAMLDPMVDSGFSSPFSPTLPLSRDEPFWARFAIVFAVIVGVVLGPAVWRARNVLSERRIFGEAVTADNVAGYRAYLSRGGHRAEVADIRLPRAELKAVAEAHTVEALEAFAASHPGSRIQSEVDAALQKAVLDEFAEAEKAGTLTALREFRQKRAAYSFIDAKVNAAMIALYKRELGRFSQGKSLPILTFYERLLGHTKTLGRPEVQVRFVRKIPESVAAMDDQVRRSGYFMGKQSVPSQYFVGDYATAREAQAAERLKKIVGGDFPADMLAVVLEPTVVQGDPPPLGETPTLIVEYAPEMAGGYMSPKPRGVFVGVGMMFKAVFHVPGGSPLEFKSSQWRTPNALVMAEEGKGVADVYEKMASDGFDKFLKAYAQYLGSSAAASAP